MDAVGHLDGRLRERQNLDDLAAHATPPGGEELEDAPPRRMRALPIGTVCSPSGTSPRTWR